MDIGKVATLVKAFFAGGIGIIIVHLGGWDVLLEVLVSLVILDYFVGVLHAVVDKRLDSSIGFKGIAKKVGYFVFVWAAFLVDKMVSPDAPIVHATVTVFLSVNEALSIVEHLAGLGVPIPKFFVDLLAKLKEQTDTGTLPQ